MKQKDESSPRVKILLVIMALLGLLAGCVTAPELTPEQVTQINVLCKDNATCVLDKTNDAMRRLYEEIEHEREDRRIQKLDKMVAYLNACDANDNLVIVEVRRGGGRSQLPNAREKRIARREYGYAYTHANLGKNIGFSKILCMSPRDVFRQLNY